MNNPGTDPRFSGSRITEIFRIQVPVIQAGMIWCSGWELASAVANAGGLGLLGSGSMYPEILRQHIRKCREATSKPFGVNVPMLYKHAPDNIKVLLEEGVKIVFTSAGNPASFTPELKSKGLTVVHVVSSLKFAKKSEECGVDAVVAEGFEAGGHNGREEITTMVLVPMVAGGVKIPVIAAGGIATGKAMFAALALGAEGVQIGSRFVASHESSGHPNFKQAVLSAGEADTLLTLKELAPVRLLRNKFFDQVSEAYRQGANREQLAELLGTGRSRIGMFEGKLDEGELEIGQVSAALKDLLPAAEILRQIVAEFHETREKLSAIGYMKDVSK